MSAHAAGPILYLDNVSVSLDGFRAINGLSLVLEPGEMRAIIGPNGAGKTTMMDIVTGKTRPDTGDVLFDQDVDLTQQDEALIARLGIGRKFQKPTAFETHSVEGRLLLSLKRDRGVFHNLFARVTDEERAKIDGLLRLIRLEERSGDPAADLSHGQKQWLEIGVLLAQDPKVLLVDEPAAGVTDTETARTADLLREVVVEHDMGFVKALGVKVTVLHEGRVLAEGPLGDVSRNPRVVDVHLGR